MNCSCCLAARRQSVWISESDLTHSGFPCFRSGEEICNTEGFTFDTRAEDLRHVWIPATLKMSISKSQGLEIVSWSEGDEVRVETITVTALRFLRRLKLFMTSVGRSAMLRRRTGFPCTTSWSPCRTSRTRAPAETWSHTSKWARRTIKEKR